MTANFLGFPSFYLFRADVSMEPGFYILLVALIVLAFVNSFVTKAELQYLRDADTPQVREYESSILDDAAIRRLIRPVPVLFTDTFRWFLQREDAMSHRALATPGSSGHGTSPVNYAALTTVDQARASSNDNSSDNSPHREADSIDDIFDETVYDDSTTNGEIIDNRRTGDALDDRTQGEIMSNEEIRSIFEALGYDVATL